MHHATWSLIEASPVAKSLYRSYRRLVPSPARTVLRWMAMPRWNAAAALVRRRAGDKVLSGPFQGMRMDLSPVSRRNLLGYLLGTHELELHDVVHRIIARNYSRIINVGAADGYYAIGLLRQMPQTTLVAFEAANEHHAGLKQAAQLNGVASRLTLKGFCRADDLERAIGDSDVPIFVLADIEGGEVDLFDPSKVEGLTRSDILVETHDDFAPNCTAMLRARFSTTHHIEQIVARPRSLADFPFAVIPELPRLMPQTAVELMNERRTGIQRWLYLRAMPRRNRPAAGKS